MAHFGNIFEIFLEGRTKFLVGGTKISFRKFLEGVDRGTKPCSKSCIPQVKKSHSILRVNTLTSAVIFPGANILRFFQKGGQRLKNMYRQSMVKNSIQ